jgi:hypothetical protein
VHIEPCTKQRDVVSHEAVLWQNAQYDHGLNAVIMLASFLESAFWPFLRPFESLWSEMQRESSRGCVENAEILRLLLLVRPICTGGEGELEELVLVAVNSRGFA